MPDDIPLTDLCSICYTNQPKYRCPRCKTRTCSLACSQKHKQRASCNGVRDPAEYFKRSQLATPAGIDRDYNYLKGVERDIETANRDSRERGVGIVTKDAPRAVARARHPGGALQKYLIDNRIHVQRAPLGMSRQKTNQTRLTKSKTIFWTVECIDIEDHKNTSHMADAKWNIRDVWSHVQTEKLNAVKRQADGNSKARTKRKRAEAAGSAQKTAKLAEMPRREGEMPTASFIIPGDGSSDEDESASKALDAEHGQARSTHEESEKGNLRYYLLRPGTSTSAKVLIPLDAEATLTSCLQDRTLLEYPTIYALPYEPNDLPVSFLTDDEYNRMRKDEDQELKEAIMKAGTMSKASEQSVKPAATDMDPQRILDMLKRDVTR